VKLGTNIQRALLKRFSGSEVKGHGHVYKCVSVIMAEAYMHFNGVASRLTCLTAWE